MQDTIYTFLKTRYDTTEMTSYFNYSIVYSAESKVPSVTLLLILERPPQGRQPGVPSLTQIPVSSPFRINMPSIYPNRCKWVSRLCPPITRQDSRGLKTQAADSEWSNQKSYYVSAGKSLLSASTSSSGTSYYCSKYLLLSWGKIRFSCLTDFRRGCVSYFGQCVCQSGMCSWKQEH